VKDGHDKRSADAIVARKAKEYESCLTQMLVSEHELKMALNLCCKALLHVFEVLEIKPRTFVVLVLVFRVEKLDDIVDFGIDEIWKIVDVPGVEDTFISNFEYFFDWFDFFVRKYGHEPNLVVEFNKIEFMRFYCNDRRYYIRLQPNRTCKR
jgi:hypothetical protein